MGRKLFNWGLNAISIACAALVIWQFAHRKGSSDPGHANSVRPGSKLVLANAAWSKAPKTLVLALSAYCQYCRASAGFYRSLTETAGTGRFQIMAVLPEPIATAKAFLPALGIDRLSDVRQADLGLIGVTATPTMMIADQSGTVQALWTGKLTEEREREVYARLGVAPPAQHPAMQIASDNKETPGVSATELRVLLKKPDTVVLDSRDRSSFGRGHIDGAINIPYDEILARGPHEIAHETTLLVFCASHSACELQKKEEGTMNFCNFTGTILGWAGIHHQRYIAGDLSTLAAQGIAVVGKPCD